MAAEFVGMLLFIFIGISAIVGKDKLDFAGAAVAQELKVALAFALAIATLAQSLGHISGAHLNPAVTLGLLVSCQISLLRCICYILAQMLGAVAASAIVNGFRHSASLGVNKVRGQSCHVFFFLHSFYRPIIVISKNILCINHCILIVNPNVLHLAVAVCLLQLNKVTVGQGFIIEFLATLQLVLCVIAVTDKRRSDISGSAPLAIGLSVGLGHFAAVRESQFFKFISGDQYTVCVRVVVLEVGSRGSPAKR